MRWRKVVLLSVVASVLAYGAWDAWTAWRLARTLRRLETIHGSLKPADLFPKKVDAGVNAAPLFRAAAEITPDDPATREQLAAFDSPKGRREVAEGRAPELERVVNENRLVFDLVAAGAARPEANWELAHNGQYGQHSWPNLTKIMAASRLIAAHAIVEARNGRSTAAAQALVEGLAFSRSTRNEPLLLVQLIRMSTDSEMLLAMRELLTRHAVGRDGLLRLEQALAISAADDPVRIGLRGELAMNEFSELTALGGDSPGRPLWAVGLVRLARPIVRVKQRLVQESVSALLEEHLSQQPSARGRFGERAVHWTSTSVAQEVVSNVASAPLRGTAGAANFVLARTAVALERRRLDGKECPVDLSELAPQYLSEAPVDPFTGKAPEYTCKDGSITLRSAGEEEAARAYPSGADPILRWSLPAAVSSSVAEPAAAASGSAKPRG